jgi:molybdenum cofactor biosynthesis enzyme MoaA
MYEFQAVRLTGTQAERCTESRITRERKWKLCIRAANKSFPIPRIPEI